MSPQNQGTRQLLPLLFVVASFAIVLPQVSSAQSSSALSPELAAAKAALSKYSDPIAAVRDGYFSTLACMDFPQGMEDGPISYPQGAMGVHFLNTANIGPTLDPMKPQVLIYEPVNGKLVLAAAEWLMPVAAANGVAPTIFGKTLLGPMDGHEPIMPAALQHYDLHVWLWRDNPRGMFVTTNSAVHCPKGAAYTVAAMPHHH